MGRTLLNCSTMKQQELSVVLHIRLQLAMLAEDFGQSALTVGLLLTEAAKKNKQKRLRKFVTHTHTHTHRQA